MLPITSRILARLATYPDFACNQQFAPPVCVALIEATEAKLGFALPPVLRELYQFVGNGIFGPPEGVIIGLSEPSLAGYPSLEQCYHSFLHIHERDEQWQWPIGLLPFYHWGCSIYSCVDCTQPNYQVMWFDVNVYDGGHPFVQAFRHSKPTIEAWFDGWLTGEDIWEQMAYMWYDLPRLAIQCTITEQQDLDMIEY